MTLNCYYIVNQAYVRLHPVEGRRAKAVHANLTRPYSGPTPSSARGAGPSNHAGGGANGNAHAGEGKTGDFMYYSDSEEEELGIESLDAAGDRLSCNFVDCLSTRELGVPSVSGGRFYSQRLSSEYGTRHMLTNAMLKETAVSVPQMNKIFCSKWLSDRRVVFGTKCNKVSKNDVNKIENSYVIRNILDVVSKNIISGSKLPGHEDPYTGT